MASFELLHPYGKKCINYVCVLMRHAIRGLTRVKFATTPRNRGCARRSTHPYAHEFAQPHGFLFVWCGIQKNNKKHLDFQSTS